MASTKRAASLRITHLQVRNWRNFKSVDAAIGRRLFVLGPNASGKSNLLDAIRFLRDLTTDGGGLQRAVRARGGLGRVRNLAARNFNKGHVTLQIMLGDDDDPARFKYAVSFHQERRGKRRPIITEEVAFRGGTQILARPDADDDADAERLTQTAIEQVNANREFREIAEHLASVRYLHLVPQMIREPDRGGDRVDDPFGGDFLARVARAPERQRAQRLEVINHALRLAVPQLDRLELSRDEDKLPHLEARYAHWRPGGARQDEKDFSDGTLRLVGLLWSLQERGGGTGPILLEEPELSLHAEVVRQLPSMIARASRASGRQVIATTHAHDILDDEGLGLDEVMLLLPGSEGTEAQLLSDSLEVRGAVDAGLSLREALAPYLVPSGIDRLASLPFSSR
jgi:predicted ATPase